MKLFHTNPYDDSILALLRASEPARPRVRVGAENNGAAPLTWLFAGIVAAGILGGFANTYFERKEREGWE